MVNSHTDTQTHLDKPLYTPTEQIVNTWEKHNNFLKNILLIFEKLGKIRGEVGINTSKLLSESCYATFLLLFQLSNQTKSPFKLLTLSREICEILVLYKLFYFFKTSYVISSNYHLFHHTWKTLLDYNSVFDGMLLKGL